MVRPDGSAELDPVPSGHLVVGDDAVDRPVSKHPLARIGTVCGSDLEALVDAGQKRRDHLGKVRFVVDV